MPTGEVTPEPGLGTELTTELALGSEAPPRRVLKDDHAAMVYNVGDRVVRLPDGPRGIVEAIGPDGLLFVHFGTTMIRDPQGNMTENRFEDWLSPEDVELSTEPVYYGTEAEKNRETIWVPPVPES